MFKPTPTWPNVDFRQLFMWIEQSHIWPFRLNITFGWLQKLNPGYEICIISYQVNLSSEVSAMFSSLMPSLNSRSLPFVVFLGGFPSRCQSLSSGAIRPGGLLLPHIASIFTFSVEFFSSAVPPGSGAFQMPTRPSSSASSASSSASSTLRGGRANLRNASVTFSLFWHEASLGWH